MPDTDAARYLVPIDATPWVADLERALRTKDDYLFESLVTPEVTWRDNLTFTWTLEQTYGLDAVRARLWAAVDAAEPHDLRITARFHEPGEVISAGEKLLEFMAEFETAAGTSLLLVWAAPDPEAPHGFRAVHLYTRLESLRGVEPPAPNPRGHGFVKEHPRENWHEHRAARAGFTDREPEVVIIGGGHGGLLVAAHLNRLGVENLVVERNGRIGDNWRNRYHNLSLHNPVEMNHLPFLPYPDNFPEYLPKDRYADWLEFYADALDLNHWTSTSFTGATYDDSAKRWTARVWRADGTERVLRPAHIVLATGGIGGMPYVPELPGLASFAGAVHHSAGFPGAAEWAGKRVIVVGTGNSAHDVAVDCYEHDLQVTMLQRGPTVVCNVETANNAYGDYFRGYDPDLVDLRFFAGLVRPTMLTQMRAFHQWSQAEDAELLDRLRAVGFAMDDGLDGTGWLGNFLIRGGGYYFNVGGSDIVAAGGIAVRQFSDVAEFVPEGLRFRDGSVVEADLVVLCTGYQNRAAELTQWFEPEVASRFDSIGPIDESGEFANAWKPTAQPGLWFMLGGIQTARPNAPLLALGVKADLDGLLPDTARDSRTTAAATR